MGKNRKQWVMPARGSAKRGPGRCIGCQRGIVYGDRCPPCQQQVRAQAAKRRRRR